MSEAWDKYWNEVHEPDGERWKGTPHGWVQWKGTNVCIDLRCPCGVLGHIDADFFYHYHCLACGKKYAVSSYVRLIELTPEQIKFVEDGGACDFISDPQTSEP